MMAMLELLDLKGAMKLAYGHKIVVIADGDISEFQLLRYCGFDRSLGRHTFLVRTQDGSLATLSEVQLGLSGNRATARLGEPERSAEPHALAS